MRESRRERRARSIVSDREIVFRNEISHFRSRNLQMCLELSFQAITNRYIAQNPIALAIVYHASILIKIPNSNDIQVITTLS